MYTGFNTRNTFKKKKKTISLAMTILWLYGLLTTPALAAPQGGTVVIPGTAAITQSGTVTNINQSAQKASINWQAFSTKPNETVNFNQPNSSSITLNRVIGSERSVLEGALNATGKVFLLNSNGVLIGKGATVNTAGFLASTLNLSDEDFNVGNYVFKSNGSSGSVINMGRITAKEGGYVALLGNSVSNQGLIAATKGTIALASGNKITLNFNGDSLLNLTIDEGTLNSLVENREAIYADGGRVILTARAADDLLSSQVNNSGLIQARTIDDLKGNIQLYAYNGTANIDGTLDASAPTTGDGGFIETSGNKVNVAGTAFITTKSAYGAYGTWLIDPESYTIGEGGDMTASYLSNALANTDMIISALSGSGSGEQTGSGHGLSHNGLGPNIYVNDAVSWSANTKLTLLADNSININAPITASGDTAILILNAGKDININNAVTLKGANATLEMNYGGDYHILTKASYSGTVIGADGYPVAQEDTSGEVYGSINFTNEKNLFGLKINGQDYRLIHSMKQLDELDGYTAVGEGSGTATSITGSYALARDLDASGTTYTSALLGRTTAARFGGTLAGLGHTISNLTINAPTTNYVGLIGVTVSGTTSYIRDIGLVDVNITGGSYVGPLIGWTYGATISGAYVTATDKDNPSTVSSSTGPVGGLVGRASSGTTIITDSYSDANVTTDSTTAGGLIGQTQRVTIINSHATGDVSSTSTNLFTSLGGLAGVVALTTVNNSYATGDVKGQGSGVGGLMGSIQSTSVVTNSFATGDVEGSGTVGGLIGSIDSGTVDNTYATGNVNSTTGSDVGGLIGKAVNTNISNSHATGGAVSTTATGLSPGVLAGIGGLVGYLSGSLTNSYSTMQVNGNGASYLGGLVGYFAGGSISGSHATGNVANGNMYVGGLVGVAPVSSCTITDSYASGDVFGNTWVGGLAGFATGSIADSYYTLGTVTASNGAVGGLVGGALSVSISGSYVLGNVTGTDQVGGLVGHLSSDSSVTNSYVDGRVSGTGAAVGGLLGYAESGGGSITNSYWNMDTTGQSNAAGASPGSGHTTMTGTRGLTNSQWPDLQYYRDGTIDQVLADRQAAADAAAARSTAAEAAAHKAAEEAAARQAAFEADAGTQAGNTTGQALQRDANPSRETGAATVLARQQQPSLDDHIVFADSSSYSAHIKAISADGVQFEMEDDSKGEK